MSVGVYALRALCRCRCLEDPNMQGACAWPDLATATEECTLWDDCAAFTCNTTSLKKKSPYQCYARGEDDVYPGGAAHKQTQGTYDPVDGSPIKRVVCFSNSERVSPFVSASLQWRDVSCH